MSSSLFKTDVLFIQRILSSSGLYKGPLDGKFNQALHDAEDAFDAYSKASAARFGTFDPRSEAAISTLVPKAQDAARQFLNASKSFPATVKLLSGTRTYVEQNALYAQGRTAKGRVVTNARGGSSNHNFGIAFDVGIFNNGAYNEGRSARNDQQYTDLAGLIKQKLPGLLEWGGDWKSIVDKPHYQLSIGKTVAQCRMLLETGKAYA
jgi:peptidoglycan L-alanyl-D-glutamate endopeptidase CwlK